MMSQDVKRGSASPRHWKLNWWDLWPMVEGEQRPIQWTSNSLILSAHPSSPAILARVFPSSLPHPLPSPNIVLNNPGAYSPPRIIEVAPCDEYIFAFFDGKGGDSVACIWHREETADAWKVNIFWPVKPGQGIVLAKWLGEERRWLRTSPPTRAPPLGPSNPFGRICLLLVNQTHTVQIVHRQSSSLSFQLIAASLCHASEVKLGDRPFMGETSNSVGGLSVCVKAAIGLGYNESSIIIATSSKILPPIPIILGPSPDPFVEGHGSSSPPFNSSNSFWELYGPDQIIRLSEVKLTSHGSLLGVSTAPLPPISPPVASSSRLTNILILPYLPDVEEPPSREGSVIDKGSPNVNEESNTLLHVVLAYLDFQGYSSSKSELMSFELKRNRSPPTESTTFVPWSHRHLTTRSIITAAVSFLIPSYIRGTGSILAGLLDLEGIVPKPSNSKGKGMSKDVGIGKVIVLKIPQLEDNENWEPSRLMTAVEDVDTNPPVSAAVSPGGSLICTSPATISAISKLGVHAHPRQHKSPDMPSPHPVPSGKSSIMITPALGIDDLHVAHMTEALLSTLLSDIPPTDILHSLVNSAFPLSSVTEVLERTLRTLDCEEFATRDWHGIISGIALESRMPNYDRVRSRRIAKDSPAETNEKTVLDECWHVALDLCSVRALERAFDASKDDDGYHLEFVWQLIGISSWLVDFSERLVRACVLWEGNFAAHSTQNSDIAANEKDTTIQVKMEIDGDNLLDGTLSPVPDTSAQNANPQLLHILHPYALDNLIGAMSHLNAFRAYMDTLNASALKAAIAKEVVVDIIDCSGIDFKELEAGLKKVRPEVAQIDADVLRRCLCSMSPLPKTHSFLLKACTIVTSPDVVSKPRLFIKPSDLVDSISRLNLVANKMHQARDIISKGAMNTPGPLRTCARCQGKTETGQIPLPRGKDTSHFGGWAAWENEWERCICGGLWVKEIL